MKTLARFLRFIASAACILAALWAMSESLMIWGPLSQAAQLKRHEEENLEAIRNANLNVVAEFPTTDITYQEPYRPIPGFKVPWTPGLFLSLARLSNGPLEGAPFGRDRRAFGLIVGNTILIGTHGWVNGRKWGIAYNPHHTTIPLPYWSTTITTDWQAWFLKYDFIPSMPGIWYK